MSLESPNQMGDKGNKGASSASASGGKLVSPNHTGNKGAQGASADQASGKLAGPAKTNSTEASGHK